MALWISGMEFRDLFQRKRSTNSLLRRLDVVDQRPVLGPQRPEDLGGAVEAVPVLVLLNVHDHALGQVLYDARLAEDVRAGGAAVDLAALPAPAAVQLRAVLALGELAAVVEVVALDAVRHTKDWMHLDVVLGGGCRAQMQAAHGAVYLALVHHIHGGVHLQVEATLLVRKRCVHLELGT